MAPLTIKRAIADALEDLTHEAVLGFCHRLRDRREKPRVRLRAVDGKSVWQIAELLVSTFTELNALQVTLEILRQINCNEEAKALESRTQICFDKGDPTLPKTSNGEVETKPSKEALKCEADRWPLRAAQHGGPPVMAMKPEEVMADAKARVLSDGGDPSNERLVLSRFRVQFGKYKGQTFKWLLENDVGYAAHMVSAHQEEREQRKQMDSLMANLDSLTQYATAYPEVLTEVRKKRAYQRSLQSGQDGKKLLGFGRYEMETLQNLYKSKDPQKISYVNFLRSKQSTCEPGSKMEVAIKYILKRDKQKAAAARRTPAKRKRVQNIRGPTKNNKKAKK